MSKAEQVAPDATSEVTNGKNVRRWIPFVLFSLFLVGFGVMLAFSKGPEPLLTLSLVGSTNINGREVETYEISNHGTAPAVHSGMGLFSVWPGCISSGAGYSFNRSVILPGETQTIDVPLPRPLKLKHQFACVLLPDTLRTRIYRWQQCPNRPKGNPRWVFPKFLQITPVEVVVRSELASQDFSD